MRLHLSGAACAITAAAMIHAAADIELDKTFR
jgi:hypothetical protein